MSISTEHSLGNKKRKKSTFKHKKLKTQTAIARGTNVKKIQIHLTKVYSDTEAKKLLYLFIFIWVLWQIEMEIGKKCFVSLLRK
jgi:hypothetical protein